MLFFIYTVNYRIRLTLLSICRSINKSHEKTEANNMLVHLSILSKYPALSVALSTKLYQYMVLKFLKRVNIFLKQLSTVIFSKRYSNRSK